jgi:hypothetical protein
VYRKLWCGITLRWILVVRNYSAGHHVVHSSNRLSTPTFIATTTAPLFFLRPFSSNLCLEPSRARSCISSLLSRRALKCQASLGRSPSRILAVIISYGHDVALSLMLMISHSLALRERNVELRLSILSSSVVLLQVHLVIDLKKACRPVQTYAIGRARSSV